MENDNLKEIIQQANDAVSGVSDPELKKIAFQKVLDKFLDNDLPQEKSDASKYKNKNTALKKSSSKKVLIKTKEKDPVLLKMLEQLDRTKYPDIHNLTKVLDQSLFILKLAKDDLKVDGLLSSQINVLLRETFRIKTSLPSIRMALMRSVKYTDRSGDGNKILYKIMHDGEVYLKETINSISKDKK
jgi:hypothetical protein